MCFRAIHVDLRSGSGKSLILIFLIILLGTFCQSGCRSSAGSARNPVAPSITAQPAAETVTAGQTATFSVGATGTDPLGFQWSKNGTAISGATSSSYTTPPTTSVDNGSQFAVVVSNSVGKANSSAATLTVDPAPTFSISGSISPAAAASGAAVILGGAATATTVANSAGVYTFTGLPNGSSSVTPSASGYTFAPANQNVTIHGANVTTVNFTGSAQGTFSISGTITPAVNGAGTVLTLSGPTGGKVTADSSGAYALGGLSNGTYTVAVSHPTSTAVTFSFTPANQSVTVNEANVSGVNFTVAAYFGTEPSHSTNLPRSDSYCSSAVNPNSWEPRPDNYAANHTVLPSSTFTWAATEDYWTRWIAKRNQVTGNSTGTTTEIIQWAACKWGIDEDTMRAVAVQESYWHQSTLGDVCGPVGEASYGLTQIKNIDCSGTIIKGGYPDTQQATALNVDWDAANMRSCYDGDFYDGGPWLYNGQTVDQIAAQQGWSYVFWACIGNHYSGDWQPGQPYQLSVQSILANRTWESPNF